MIVFLFFSVSYAQTTLSGSLGTLTLDSTGSPYTITDNLTIGQGKTLTIGPGCILLFKPYSGIEVSGDLIVQGTAEKPVVFTSINDDKWSAAAEKMPEAFDWNGIRVQPGGRALMSRFLISYSVYGIQSQSDDIMISEGVFNQNGQFNFTLSGKILAVQENLPFTYKTEKPKREPNRKALRFAVPIISGTAGIGLGAAAGYFFYRKTQIHDDYLAATSIGRIEYLLDKEKTARNRAIACTIASGVLLPVTVGLVVYAHRTSKPVAISIQPQLGAEYAALTILGRF